MPFPSVRSLHINQYYFILGGDNRRKGGVCIEIIEYEITISIDLRYQGDRKMHMSLEFRECIMFEKIFLEVISISMVLKS